MTLLLTHVFAILTLVTMGASVALLVSPRARALAAPHLVGIVSAVTGTATLGSLYLSEVAGYIPCDLCWVQRIFMYPLAVITTVALIRRRGADLWAYAVPLAAIGLPISIWHIVIQRLPAAGGACDPAVPCSSIWIERFGFVTIPVMAGAAFLLVLVAGWVAVRTRTPSATSDTTQELTHER